MRETQALSRFCAKNSLHAEGLVAFIRWHSALLNAAQEVCRATPQGLLRMCAAYAPIIAETGSRGELRHRLKIQRANQPRFYAGVQCQGGR